MYNISVPVNTEAIKEKDRERLLRELKKLDATRVFLTLGTYQLDKEKREISLNQLKENCRFFKERGFEVGAWIWTFMITEKTDFTNMRSLSGEEFTDFMCPADKGFLDFAGDYIRDIAKCGIDIIMFDDDFRYGFLGQTPACLCDNHIAEINRITGDTLGREGLEKYITSGKPNIYRDAYIRANGDALRNFASKMRAAVDTVNSDIRLGACACMTSWDIDGTDARELAYILAGNTKPFVRLIGAPYWSVTKMWGNSLSDVIELERMESAWTKDGNIEILAEGDTYPRPRSLCPASYLEGFDTAMRVSGAVDGILKYGIDYYSNVDYETGYAKFHKRNRDTYITIDKMFGDKVSCGIRVYEAMKKVSNMTMPTKVNKTVSLQDMFFSKAARTLTFNSVPTVYEGDGVCGIVFDENARTLSSDAMKNGLIIDIAAAEILMERGFDVGIKKIGEPTSGMYERFLDTDNKILALHSTVYDLELNDSAEILSDMETPSGVVPVSFRYENADGNRFLIMNINSRLDVDCIPSTNIRLAVWNNLFCHYERSRQYAQQTEWLSGKKLPAYSYGNPGLYIQCKENSQSMSVGLWNFHADMAIEPVIELGKKYSKIRFWGCVGRLVEDKVFLDDINPFSFVAFEVE